MSELCKLGIKAAQEGLAKGDFTSVELVQAVIDAYRSKNGDVGAYLTFDEEAALKAAAENPNDFTATLSNPTSTCSHKTSSTCTIHKRMTSFCNFFSK